MGRRERPLDPQAGPLERFAGDLRALRRSAGSPSYQELARRTHFAASTLASCASGRKLPTASVLAAYVAACEGDVDQWEERRRRTQAVLCDVRAGEPEGERTTPGDTPRAPLLLDGPAGADEGGSCEKHTSPGRAARPCEVAGTAVSRRGVGVVLRRGLRLVTVVLMVTFCTASQFLGPSAPSNLVHASWLHPAADVPDEYRAVIVRAGTLCSAPQVTPALIAAILKVESNFDPDLSDPASDEYGIARWTPRVLRYYLPPARQNKVPEPPLDPQESIMAMGRMLCTLAPQLEGVAGDPALNLAAAYRTATFVVQKENGIPARLRPYTDKVRAQLMLYAPQGKACLPYAVMESSYPAPCGP